MVLPCVDDRKKIDGFEIISSTKKELEAERDELLDKHGIGRDELYHLNDIGDLSESEYLLYVKVKEIDFALDTLY